MKTRFRNDGAYHPRGADFSLSEREEELVARVWKPMPAGDEAKDLETKIEARLQTARELRTSVNLDLSAIARIYSHNIDSRTASIDFRNIYARRRDGRKTT